MPERYSTVGRVGVSGAGLDDDTALTTTGVTERESIWFKNFDVIIVCRRGSVRGTFS